MKLPGIYKIKSLSHPERCYIGSAVDISQRWRVHKSELKSNTHHSGRLQNHYNKYGLSDLIIIILEPCLTPFLIIREQYYIDSLKPYFNIRKIAESNFGLKRTEESKQRMRKPHKKPEGIFHLTGSKQSIETIQKRLKSREGYRHSEETKDKMRQHHREWSDEERKNKSNSMKGNKNRLGGLKYLNKSA